MTLKNEKLKNQKILWDKLVIFHSFIKPSLKTSIINVANQPLSVFSAVLGPIVIYYKLISENDFKNFLPLLEKNLPGFNLPSQTMTWDTFQKTNYFPQSQSGLETNQQIAIQKQLEKQLFENATVDIHYWGTFLTCRLTDQWNSYKKQYFFGIKNASSHKNTGIDQKSLMFLARDNVQSRFYSNLISNEKYQIQPTRFYQLDEFPLKLQNNHVANGHFKLTIQPNQKLNLQQVQQLTLEFNNVNQTKPYSQLIGVQFQPSVNQIYTRKTNLVDAFRNENQFQTKLTEIETSLKNQFYETGYLPLLETEIPDNGLSRRLRFLNKKFRRLNASQIYTLANEVDSQGTSISKPLNLTPKFQSLYPPRQMSGYLYPDMATAELEFLNQRNFIYSKWVALVNFWKETKESLPNQIWIDLGHHFSYPTRYDYVKTLPKNLKFKYYQAQFESPPNNIVKYKGPSLVLSDNGIYTRTAPNQFQILKDLQDLFHKNDPTHLDFSSFLSNKTNEEQLSGIEPISLFKAQKLQFVEENSEYNSFFEPLAPNYFYQPVVPYLTSREWEECLNQFDSEFQNLYFSNSFPIRILSRLKTTKIQKSFDNLDYQSPFKTFYSIFGTSNDQSKLIYVHYPTLQSSFAGNVVRTTLTNSSYVLSQIKYNRSDVEETFFTKWLNELTLLGKSRQKQIFEPLHEGSWLIISQYILAILIFNVLKTFTASYGKELIAYLLDLISAFGIVDSSLKDEFDSGNSKYRIIQKPPTRFYDIAGLEPIFSQLSEMVWSLRTGKKFFTIPTKISKGILLIGPPGTGKTLLVKAIAGEAQIPIFMQPSGAFQSEEEIGAQRLERLFEKAKQVAPSIIFFDELDSIGQRRTHILQNITSTDNLFTILLSPFDDKNSVAPIELFNPTIQKTDSLNQPSQKLSEDPAQLNLLMQLLIELDGLQSTKKVLVMGATNRMNVLDPALIRPGRFDQLLKLGLPPQKKRIQICQLYASKLGTESCIYWDFLGNYTLGLSGADLAAIMNQSTIDAILNSTKHTMQTIELAVDKIIGDDAQKPMTQYFQKILKKVNQPNENSSLIPRFAYYHASQTVIELLLPDLANPIFSALFPKPKNARYQKTLDLFFTNKVKRSTRKQLQSYIISLYSGKMAEFLFFKKGLGYPNYHLSHSTLGSQDCQKATYISYQLIYQWYLYSTRLLTYNQFPTLTNQNIGEFENSAALQFLDNISKEVKQVTISPILDQFYLFQQWSDKASWQIHVTHQQSSLNLRYSNWYRIYLKNPDEVMDNDEWVAPDVYYHKNSKDFLTKTLYCHTLVANKRDSIYQTLVQNLCRQTLEILSDSSEFIDFFASLLIQNELIRDFEIQNVYSQFQKHYYSKIN